MQSWWTTKLLAAIALGMLGVCGMKWAMRKAREIFVNLRVMPLCALAALLVGGVISTVEAQKRGGGNISRGNAERAEVVRNDEPYGGLGQAALTERGLSDATLPLRGGETGYSVTAEDIARGWRVESVTTNAAFGYLSSSVVSEGLVQSQTPQKLRPISIVVAPAFALQRQFTAIPWRGRQSESSAVLPWRDIITPESTAIKDRLSPARTEDSRKAMSGQSRGRRQSALIAISASSATYIYARSL